MQGTLGLKCRVFQVLLMPASRRKAGRNIRHLARKRRSKALFSFLSAAAIAVMPFGISKVSDVHLQRLSALNPQRYQAPTVHFPFYFYALFILLAWGLVFNGFYLWKRANHADRGAKGEEDVAQILAPLTQQGWQIEYGTPLKGGLGDADIICISPKDRAYAIDVKSHRGEVSSNGKTLQRRMGRSTYDFEKDFLAQSMKQALQIKKTKNLSFVTPIIAFSQAKVAVPPGKIRGVYVVEKSRLPSLLKTLS
jgi:Nuclease-related domain